jgi:hypothetical protein
MKSDIFFFITSISVIITTLFLLVALFYFIKILRNFYKISDIFKNYTENADEELRRMGTQIRQSKIFTFIFGKEKESKKDQKK